VSRPLTLTKFGLGLAFAVFLDAIVVRSVLLPAVLELLGPVTWRLPRRLDAWLPHINIEGSAARALSEIDGHHSGGIAQSEPAPAAA
jgi:putative drug exporter of the RND superfamily